MQCAVWSSSSIKNTKTKENAKGNAKSKYDAVRATYLVPHTHTHWYSYNYNYISCRAAGRNAVTTEAVPGASTRPVPQVPPVRRSPLNVSKDETPQGEWGLRGREAVQAHKTSGVNLQCRLSPSLSPSLSHCSSLFLRFLCKCSGCVSARLRLSRVSVLKCPFLLANEAGQNGCWPQHSRCVNVCV